jgi:transmembrane sensor
MFRHTDLNKQHGINKDFNLDFAINQSIRYFKVPAVKDKSDVLNFLMQDISEFKIIRPEKNRARRLYVAIGSIASAACLLLFLLYFTYSFETFSGVQGENNTFYLPDHSKVILTANSQIRFPKLFFNRNVSLRGEAYFEVEKGSKFTVKTPNGEVKVLGTRFSVLDKEDGFVVYCFEGKVEVKYKKEERQLCKGNEFIGNENVVKAIDLVETPYPEFVYFDRSFFNVNVNEIWPVIEKHFGVKINSEISVERKFTGSIHSTDVKEVIEIICTSLDLNFEQVSGNEILIKSASI